MASLSLAFDVLAKDNASKTFDHIGKSTEHAAAKGAAFGAIMGTALTKAAGAIAGFAKESLNAFGDVGSQTIRLQRQMGGTAESVSRLRFAAQETGVDIDIFGKSLGILSKHLAANDKAAKSLGIAYRDTHGHLLPMDTLLPKLAGKFASMPNGIEKTAEVLKVFGRGGLALLPFLNRGAAGLAELAKESDKFGLTLSQKDTKAVYENTIAKRKWHAAIEGVQVQLGRHLYPALTKIAGFLTTDVIPIIQKVAGPVLAALGSAFHLVGGLLSTVTERFITAAGGAVAIQSRFAAFAALVRERVIPAVREAGEWLVAHLQPAFHAISSVITGTIVPAFQKLLAKIQENKPHLEQLGQILLTIGSFILTKVAPAVIYLQGHVFGLMISAVGKAIGIIGGLIGVFVAVGTAIGKFAYAVTTTFTSAVNFIKSVPGKIKSALGDLGNLLYSAGKDLLFGLVRGMRAAIGAAVGAAKSVASSVKNAVTGFLGIQSPSKVFHVIGGQTVQGLANGLKDHTKHATASALKLAKAVTSSYQSTLRDEIKADKISETLTKKTIAGINARIASIKTLAQTYKDYGKQIADSARSFADPVSTFGSLSTGTSLLDLGITPAAGQSAYVGAQNNVGGLVSGMGDQLGTIKRFASELAALAKRGLNKALLTELYQAGPGQIALVDALFVAGGADLASVNSLSGQIDAASASLGSAGVGLEFGAGPQAKVLSEAKTQTALLKKLEAALARIEAVERGQAQQLAASLNSTASQGARQGAARAAR